jgi:hypothetical protein
MSWKIPLEEIVEAKEGDKGAEQSRCLQKIK